MENLSYSFEEILIFVVGKVWRFCRIITRSFNYKAELNLIKYKTFLWALEIYKTFKQPPDRCCRFKWIKKLPTKSMDENAARIHRKQPCWKCNWFRRRQKKISTISYGKTELAFKSIKMQMGKSQTTAFHLFRKRFPFLWEKTLLNYFVTNFIEKFSFSSFFSGEILSWEIIFAIDVNFIQSIFRKSELFCGFENKSACFKNWVRIRIEIKTLKLWFYVKLMQVEAQKWFLLNFHSIRPKMPKVWMVNLKLTLQHALLSTACVCWGLLRFLTTHPKLTSIISPLNTPQVSKQQSPPHPWHWPSCK